MHIIYLQDNAKLSQLQLILWDSCLLDMLQNLSTATVVDMIPYFQHIPLQHSYIQLQYDNWGCTLKWLLKHSNPGQPCQSLAWTDCLQSLGDPHAVSNLMQLYLHGQSNPMLKAASCCNNNSKDTLLVQIIDIILSFISLQWKLQSTLTEVQVF